VRRQSILILTASAFGFIVICIAVIEAWDIFTEARSQTPAPQEQMPPAELSAAIEAQRQSYAEQRGWAIAKGPAIKRAIVNIDPNSLGMLIQ
jgi:hypothetical protein